MQRCPCPMLQCANRNTKTVQSYLFVRNIHVVENEIAHVHLRRFIRRRRTAAISVTSDTMKHIVKIMSLLVVMLAVWVGLLQASIVPYSYTWLLPIYSIVSLGCYGLLMVGVGLMQFPTCPQESILLQKDIVEAKEFLKKQGVDVGSD
ncbi:hypothetical protein ACET3Z_014074 [Daucus carota]